MLQTNLNSSLMATVCYCVLALGVTCIVAQDGSKGTETSTQPASASTAVASNSPALPEKIEPASKLDNIPTGTPSTSPNLTTNVGSPTTFVAPDWFPAEPKAGITSKDGVDTIPISEPGYGTRLQVQSRELILEEVANYLDQQLGEGASQYVRFSIEDLDKMGVISNQAFVTGTDENTGEKVPAQMFYASLKLNSDFRKKAKRNWIEQRQSSRLMQIGLVSGGLLLVIGFLFGSLRLNSATSGFYQGRLQFLSGVVILGIICVATYFGLQLDWI